MFRAVLRFVSFVFLVLMVIVCVTDAARSVGASTLIMSPFNVTLAEFFQTNLQGVNEWIYAAMPSLIASIVAAVCMLPAWIVFGVVSLLFFMVGYNRRPRFHKIAY
ncbi:hypothetical protein [Bartonella sp. LJL80]